jgi:hypothetical protein
MSTHITPVATHPPPIAVITYADLWNQYEAYLLENKKAGEANNTKTALKGFKQVHNLTDQSIPGSELEEDEEFEQRLEMFLDSQRNAGIKPSTCKTRSTYLNNFRKFYIKYNIKTAPLPTDFAGRLKRRIEELGLTPWQFYERHLMSGHI